MVLFTHSFLSSRSSLSSMSYSMKVSVSRPNTSSINGWAEPCSTAHRLPVTIISTSLHVANRNCREKQNASVLRQLRPRWGRRKCKTDFTSWKNPTRIAGCASFPWPLFGKGGQSVSFYIILRVNASKIFLIAVVYSLLIVLRSCHGPAWGKSENTERCTNNITKIRTITACVGL